MLKTRFKKPGPAYARPRAVRVMICRDAGTLCRAGHDRRRARVRCTLGPCSNLNEGARSKSKCNIFWKKCCMGTHYRQLSIEEQTIIQTQLEMGMKPAAIARGLNCSPSTVCRELRRNGWTRPIFLRQVGRPRLAGGYRAAEAEARAQACAATPRIERRLRPQTALWKFVMRHLKQDYSPEQIAGTLALVHPDTPSLQVSHETIYTAIYAMPRGELRTQVIGWLRFGHAKRRPRARGEDRRGPIPDMVSIHDRPPEVE